MKSHKAFSSYWLDLLTPKAIGVLNWSWPTIIQKMGTISKCVVLLLITHALCVQGQCDLDLWPTKPIIIRGLLLIMTNHHTKSEDRITMRYLVIIGQAFCVQGQCFLDLWQTDPKINRGLILVMTNHHTKNGDHISMCYLVIDQSSFLCSRPMFPRPLTYWPQNQKGFSTGHDQPPYQIGGPYHNALSRYWSNKLFVFKAKVTFTSLTMTPKSIWVLYWSWPTIKTNMPTPSQSVVLLLTAQAVCGHSHFDLDLSPTDPKINRGLLLFMTNLHTKYGDRITMLCLVIDRTSFLCSRSLWPWPLTNWHQNQ